MWWKERQTSKNYEAAAQGYKLAASAWKKACETWSKLYYDQKDKNEEE